MKSDKIFITGLLGLFGSLVVGVGEFYLHYSPQMLDNAQNFNFFNFVSQGNLITGHFLAVIGIPFYFIGYYHVYRMLEVGNKRLALTVFLLGVLSFSVGGFWITSRAFLGTIVQLQNEIPTGTYKSILNSYDVISESLVRALRVVILILSIVFVVATLKGNTHYKKWMAISNPIVLLLIVFAIFYIAPEVGKYIAPIAMNVAHFVLFSLSLYQARQINYSN